MTKSTIILWFRYDLRLSDNPSLALALHTGQPIIPCYIYDNNYGQRPLGSASKWWLHQSLKRLDEKLKEFGSRLIFRMGDSRSHLEEIASLTGATSIICSTIYESKALQADQNIKAYFAKKQINFQSQNATYLLDPTQIKTKEGRAYRVFTPFAKACLAQLDKIVPILNNVQSLRLPTPQSWPDSCGLDALNLRPTLTKSGKDWSDGFRVFEPGEDSAKIQLQHFLDHGLSNYSEDRDRPDLDVTSKLSAHLRFGNISPWYIWQMINETIQARPQWADQALKFKLELLWREFSNNLLAQMPMLQDSNLNNGFNAFPWRDDARQFEQWCRGQTGYDLVDAGMQQLWQTGFMHNRVRMIAASFLTKHLLIDWRYGEKWFWDCLLDADPANNPASWQWVAGCGADAAPYFRIFNPITSAERFDPQGRYRQAYLGQEYAIPIIGHRPNMMVEHRFARQRALDAYQALRLFNENAD